MTARPHLLAAFGSACLFLGSTAVAASATTPGDGAPAESDGSVPAASVDVVGEWSVVSAGGIEAAGMDATVEFTDDGQVQGSGGVNTFRGEYAVVPDGIEFGPIVTTLMAGPEPAMALENALLATLAGTQPVAVDGDELTLGTGDGAVVLERAADASAIVTVSGFVTYLERMALPDGAVVEVRVSDVSRADAAAVVLAEARVIPTHQVPIPYAIAVSGSSFEDRHRYSLSVRITVDGELLFTSTENIPVSPDTAVQYIDVELSRAG